MTAPSLPDTQSLLELMKLMDISVSPQMVSGQALVCWRSAEIIVLSFSNESNISDAWAEALLCYLTQVTIETENYRSVYGDEAQLQWAFTYGYEPRYGEIVRNHGESLEAALFRTRRVAQAGRRVWAEMCAVAERLRWLFGSFIEVLGQFPPTKDHEMTGWRHPAR